MIHNVLAQQPVGEQAFAAETGYRLDQNHVALIVWGREETTGGDGHRALEQFIRRIASRCAHGGPPLIIAVDSTTAWAWIPMRRPERLDMEVVRELTTSAGGCRVAIGLPSNGISGFRRSHEQAQATRQMMLVSPTTTPRAVSFGDEGVAIVSLLATNLDATAVWVGEVLGPLARDDESASVLRETLRVFFATSENYARTAELLNVHRNTVKYRINKVFGEKRHRDATDRMDIALALQVCRFLGTKVLRPPGTH
jgi:DNA-binding PucR family transcriptional regulator